MSGRRTVYTFTIFSYVWLKRDLVRRPLLLHEEFGHVDGVQQRGQRGVHRDQHLPADKDSSHLPSYPSNRVVTRIAESLSMTELFQ